MARLVVMYGSRHTRTIALDVERLVIGRGKKAGLSLKNQTISREHCALELRGNRHVLVDLGSTSGTWVNGTRIEAPVTLGHGDAIELGKHTLKYERDAIETGATAAEASAPQFGWQPAEPPRGARPRGTQMVEHVFEFIALECVRQNEPGGDEVYIRFGSEKVYPPGRGLVPFKAGGVLVNPHARIPKVALMEFLGRRGCAQVEDDESTASFRRAEIPQHGFTVEVMEHDLWTRHDRIGRILVSSKPTGGPVLHVFDTREGHYRLTYQVLAEQGEEDGA